MKYNHFSIEEREMIQQMLWDKQSIRQIAKELKRSPSSVSREIKRNKPVQRHLYTPRLANERALKKRSSRGREERLKDQKLRDHVIKYLKDDWSPEQIAGSLKQYLPGYKISHEAIYQFIYAQIYRNGHGLLKPGKEDLRPYLKRRHKRRQKKGFRKQKRVCRPENPSIEDRPKIIEKRKRIGDWESDSVVSKKNGPGINTLVDRKSGYVLISKLHARTAAETARVIKNRLKQLPKNALHTITFDNGSENQRWDDIEKEINVDCYFAHPYSSWERGSNENTNGLIRWYFPKGTDFQKVSDKALQEVEWALNNRPRKRLGYKTPLQVFNRSVALQC